MLRFALVVVALAGCRQLFGIDDTALGDASAGDITGLERADVSIAITGTASAPASAYVDHLDAP